MRRNMLNILKNKIFIIIAVFLLVIALFSSLYLSRINKTAVRIEMFPVDTNLRIDGHRVGRGTAYFKPGTYEIEASRKGFKSYSGTVEIDTAATPIAIMLDPESNEAKKIFTDHQADYNRAREVSYEALQKSNTLFNEKNPIISKLPYKTFMYQIGYIRDATDPTGMSIIVTIYASETYRQAALYRIYQLGFDPTDLNIVFKDYENPFPL